MPVPTIWCCPQCDATMRTADDGSTPLHRCPSVAGLAVPLVPAGTKARHLIVGRGDYVGKELVQTDADGRPAMAVYTERPDGSHDTTVYMPTATAQGRA